ncbi:MAG: hypothetical protein IJX17_05870 [Clostridia bacterium]|nr:hypothetical protein [Clostridia bacterium]
MNNFNNPRETLYNSNLKNLETNLDNFIKHTKNCAIERRKNKSNENLSKQ